MDALREFRCAKCGVVDAAGCEQTGCPERPELSRQDELKCMRCNWQGSANATAMFGSLSMLCPDCGTATSKAVAVLWIPVEASLPNAETSVLLALDCGEVWFGFLDDQVWRDAGAMPFAPLSEGRVTHWAHLPASPARVPA